MDPIIEIPVTTVISLLKKQQDSLIKQVMVRFFDIHPDARERYGEKGVAIMRTDLGHHIQYLCTAIEKKSPTFFADYLAWVNNMLRKRLSDDTEKERATNLLHKAVELLAQEIRKQSGESVWKQAQPAVDLALQKLVPNQKEGGEFVMPPTEALMDAYLNSVISGQRLQAQDIVMEAFRNGLSIRDVYLQIFQPALYEVGSLWETGQISVAKEHLATAITQTILSQIYSESDSSPRNGQSAIVACLAGNHHEIGARMVADFLQLSGYESLFLGANTPDEDLLVMIDELHPSVVGLPSTLSSQVTQVKEAISKIRSDFTTYRPTILVGGLAFNLVDGLWKQVGADLWGADAGLTLDELIGGS